MNHSSQKGVTCLSWEICSLTLTPRGTKDNDFMSLAAHSLCSSSTGFLLKEKLPRLFKGHHKTLGDTIQLWHPPQRHLCVLLGLGARLPASTNFLPVFHMKGRAPASARNEDGHCCCPKPPQQLGKGSSLLVPHHGHLWTVQ